MPDISTLSAFLNRPSDVLIAEAEKRGGYLLPDTRVSPEFLVETLGFEPASAAGGTRPKHSFRFQVVAAGLITAVAAGIGIVAGICFLYPLPEWLRPTGGTPPLWSILGYLFWGVFSAVWGVVLLSGAFRIPSLPTIVEGLLLRALPIFKRTGNHTACFLRVSVLYRFVDRPFVGSIEAFGKTLGAGQSEVPASVLRKQAAFPEGSRLPVYLNPDTPDRFELEHARYSKSVGLLVGLSVLLCAVTMFALAGALIPSFG